MIVTVNALVPVLLLVVLGWWLRRRGILDEGFRGKLERLTYSVLTPALFVASISRADLTLVDPVPMLVALAGSTLAVVSVLLLLRRTLAVDGPAFTSVVQGGIRLNTYIGVMVAAGLHGTDGVAVFAMAAAVVVPLVNVVCVTVLVRHGDGDAGMRSLPKQLATNPLILGCLAGLLVNIARLPIPAPLLDTASILGDAAPALGTICVGAALAWQSHPKVVRALAVSSVVKLVALPVVAAGLCRLLHVDETVATAVVLIQGLPVAASAYVLARRMGGDAVLMSAITAGQTALGVVTLPLVLQLV